MDESENKNTEGKEILFQVGYKRRSKEDIFKFFIIENRKTLRGFKRILPIAIVSISLWLITKNTITLIIMIPLALLLLIVLFGYFQIWRERKKWENMQTFRRVLVTERKLKYGDFGIIMTEESKNGLSQEKYVWNRYRIIIEWGTWLFLLPAKKKAHTFEINKDEIGKENFSKFRDFAKNKLEHKFISNYKEII